MCFGLTRYYIVYWCALSRIRGSRRDIHSKDSVSIINMIDAPFTLAFDAYQCCYDLSYCIVLFF